MTRLIARSLDLIQNAQARLGLFRVGDQSQLSQTIDLANSIFWSPLSVGSWGSLNEAPSHR
ncbi:MAG: hypothetical protein QNL33_00355 [Akkermansiaceae bacterium]